MRRNIPFKDYLLFAEAWGFLGLARLILLLFPFRKIVSMMGPSIRVNEQSENTKSPPPILKKVSASIQRASTRSPWRTQCFEQALAARMMLKHRKLESILYFGVAKSDRVSKPLSAHAWLKCCGQSITGGKDIQKFKIISCFRS